MRFLALASLFVLVCFASAKEWPHLITTFGTIPGLGTANDDQPRTEAELLDGGWVQMSSCDDNHPNFAGNRWARSENDKDIVIITDVNGFIAGEQSVVMRKYSNIYFDFDSSPFYVLDDFFGEEAYLATAYFVDPEIICNGGRTDEEFALQGTGDRLFFQNGPTASDLEEIPLTQAEMDAGGKWYKHLCFTNMGVHYLNFPPADDEFDCNNLTPFQVTYDNGLLNGFVFQHIANMEGNRWEYVPRFVLSSIIDQPPKCLLDATTAPGITTMHNWVTDYLVSC